MATIRALKLPEDAEGILALDISLETDQIYRVETTNASFHLVETRANLFKQYSLDMDDIARLSALHYAVVAMIDDSIVGLAAAEYAEWNRRAIIHHLYIDRDYRRAGIGKQLLQDVTAWSRKTAARCLWLETQNTNFPAIAFYRRAGFTLCGFDVSLYDPEHVEPTESAVFFSKSLG